MKFMAPSMLFVGLFDLNKRWLACLRITFVPMVCMMIATIIHIPLCYGLVFGLDLGVEGIAIATSVKDGALLLSVLIYMRCSEPISSTLATIDREAFHGWC